MKDTKKQKETSIRVFYEKSPDFKYYYATGAKGGPLSVSDITLTFFSDHRIYSSEDIIKDGKLTPCKSLSDNYDEKILVKRIEEFELTLSPFVAKELKDLLDRILKNYKIEKREDTNGHKE
jgi:hypothetical protein